MLQRRLPSLYQSRNPDRGARIDVMPTEAVAGFWSYAHEDDKLDGGAILELARLIAEEYNLISGEPLELFVDRDSIAWGEEWRSRIDGALTQTTFFIPIITPRYFTRPECCRELLEFTAKAKSLGVQELLLPILYVEPQDFSMESQDEAVLLIAKTQYVDWRTNRLAEFSSREYRSSVNALARRLLEIARTVSENQFNRELKTDPEEKGTYGITDVLERVEALLPPWLDAVMGEKINYPQIKVTLEHSLKQVAKLRARRAAHSAVLNTQIRMAKELLPLLERVQRDSGIYLARSIELDPLVSTLSRLIGEHPDDYELVMPVREAIDEAMATIHEGDRERQKPGRNLISIMAESRHLGRVFQRCYAIALDWDRLADEGNEIVRRWDSELRRPAELRGLLDAWRHRFQPGTAVRAFIAVSLLYLLAV
jgi:hypothetical protein